jgi:hypothetical protein
VRLLKVTYQELWAARVLEHLQALAAPEPV